MTKKKENIFPKEVAPVLLEDSNVFYFMWKKSQQFAAV